MSDVTKWVEDRTILKVYRGSHAYGTNHKDSDVDLGGVCIPPKEFIIGYDHFEQWENKNYTNFKAYNKLKKSAEITIFALHKFINLAFNCNPNVIEHLFVNPTHIMHCNDYGKKLIENRNLFLTKRARHTFGGYAFSQLKRLTNKLPMDEAKAKIERLEIKKQEYNIYLTKLKHRKEMFNNKQNLTDDEALLLIGLKSEEEDYTERIAKLDKEIRDIEFLMGGGNHNHHGSHKSIIDEYGFDTKHAMHLIRLLHMGLEILVDGECNVLRPDNNYLLAIRNGEYTLEYIQAEADRLFKLLDDAYVNSKLPNSPDRNKINKLLCDMTLSSFEKG
jgi:hypothetical protein